MRRRLVDLHRPGFGAHFQLFQGPGQGVRVTAVVRAGGVGLKLPRPGNGHSDDGGGNRHYDSQDEQADGVAAAVVLIVAVAAEAAENSGDLRHKCQHRYGAGNGGNHRHNQSVPVAHMSHFVRHHAGQFLAGQDAADAGGHGDGSVFGAAPGSKGVGGIGVNFVHFGHRHIGQPRLLRNQLVKLRVIIRRNRLGVRHAESDFVAEPVGPKVQQQGENQGNDDADLSAHCAANSQQQAGQYHQQEKGLNRVHSRTLSGWRESAGIPFIIAFPDGPAPAQRV